MSGNVGKGAAFSSIVHSLSEYIQCTETAQFGTLSKNIAVKNQNLGVIVDQSRAEELNGFAKAGSGLNPNLLPHSSATLWQIQIQMQKCKCKKNKNRIQIHMGMSQLRLYFCPQSPCTGPGAIGDPHTNTNETYTSANTNRTYTSANTNTNSKARSAPTHLLRSTCTPGEHHRVNFPSHTLAALQKQTQIQIPNIQIHLQNQAVPLAPLVSPTVSTV